MLSRNAESPITVTEDGILILVRFALRKAYEGIEVRLVGMLTDFKEVHPSNVLLPRVVTLGGMVTDVRDVH